MNLKIPKDDVMGDPSKSGHTKRFQNRKKKSNGNSRYRKTNHKTSKMESFEMGEGDIFHDPAKLHERALRFQRKQEDSENKAYGFVSRGEDNRLQKNPEERIEAFQLIIANFVRYLNQNKTMDLRTQFADLFVKEGKGSQDEDKYVPKDEKSEDVTLLSILSSLRKLREALIYQKADEFTKKVFLFSIRIASKIGHYQTYIPSIMFLLQSKNISLLTQTEKEELAAILVLHTAHYGRRNAEALRLYCSYQLSNYRIRRILESWIQDDYVTWIHLYNSEINSSFSSILEAGIPYMVRHMIEAMTASYFNYTLKDFSKLLPHGIGVEGFFAQFNPNWRIEGDYLVIRERKRLQ